VTVTGTEVVNLELPGPWTGPSLFHVGQRGHMPQSVSLPTNKPGFRLQMGAYPSSEERISQTSWAVVYGGAGSPAVAVGLEFNGKTTMEVGSLLVVPPQGNGTSPPSDGPTVSVVSTIDRLNVTTNASFVVPSFFAVLFTPQSSHTVSDKTLTLLRLLPRGVQSSRLVSSQ
jgi:hypothetical protein